MNAVYFYVFLTSCAILFVIPLLFVYHSVYEDGLIGRCFLLGMSFGAATFLMEIGFGEQYDMLPQTVFLVACFAGFLCWHLFRFHTRVLRKKRDEAMGPRETQRSTPWISSP